MFEERLENSITGMGYQRMNSNAPGVYLYYSNQGEELRIVSILRLPFGTEVTQEQYHNLLNQIKKNFLSTYPYQLSLLSLILTNAPDQAKLLCTENSQDNHWMVDIPASRLIIYENQVSEFAGLRSLIEAILEEEYRSSIDLVPSPEGVRNPYLGQGTPRNSMNHRNIVTAMNASLIVINIIAYLITHYAPFFGGPSGMLTGGALSWYEVFEEKQYYRILTAMFMHMDISHLFNNMLVLLFVGYNLERAVGKLRYLCIYFSAGVIAGITSIGYNMWQDYGLGQSSSYSIGASGAIFGVVGAVLFIVLINRGRLEDIDSRQMVMFVIFSLYGGIANTHIDLAAHVGGFIAGFILAALLYRRKKNTITPEQQI